MKRLLRNSQKKEARKLLDFLSSCDAEEVALLMVVAYETAEMYKEKRGLDFFQPQELMVTEPGIVSELEMDAFNLGKMKEHLWANGTKVWLFSMLSWTDHEFRNLARKIWGELARGFLCASQAASEMESELNQHCRVSRVGQFPKGLSPVPK